METALVLLVGATGAWQDFMIFGIYNTDFSGCAFAGAMEEQAGYGVCAAARVAARARCYNFMICHFHSQLAAVTWDMWEDQQEPLRKATQEAPLKTTLAYCCGLPPRS